MLLGTRLSLALIVSEATPYTHPFEQLVNAPLVKSRPKNSSHSVLWSWAHANNGVESCDGNNKTIATRPFPHVKQQLTLV